MTGRTFGVDLLAHTAHPSILDGPVTTINVEQTVLEEQHATAQEEESAEGTA